MGEIFVLLHIIKSNTRLFNISDAFPLKLLLISVKITVILMDHTLLKPDNKK